MVNYYITYRELVPNKHNTETDCRTYYNGTRAQAVFKDYPYPQQVMVPKLEKQRKRPKVQIFRI